MPLDRPTGDPAENPTGLENTLNKSVVGWFKELTPVIEALARKHCPPPPTP
jgi:hypothetical protein